VGKIEPGDIHSRKYELLDSFGRGTGRAYCAYDLAASDFRTGFHVSINKTFILQPWSRKGLTILNWSSPHGCPIWEDWGRPNLAEGESNLT
jgi:hypothetical protein